MIETRFTTAETIAADIMEIDKENEILYFIKIDAKTAILYKKRNPMWGDFLPLLSEMKTACIVDSHRISKEATSLMFQCAAQLRLCAEEISKCLPMEN